MYDAILYKLNREELSIFKTILRLFTSSTCFESNLIRSPHYTIDEITFGFPDELEQLVINVTQKMVQAHILIDIRDKELRYTLNPNHRQQMSRISLDTIKPIEELFPKYKFVFEKKGTKTSKGSLCKYIYFQHTEDKYSFRTIIESGNGENRKNIDMGSFNKANSILLEVWSSINKISTQKFTRVELEQLIPNRLITQNRQPLRAALDILEFLGYIEKTGKKINRSEEYSKTNLKLDLEVLDKYFESNYYY